MQKSILIVSSFLSFQIQLPSIIKRMFDCKKWTRICNILVILIILDILIQIYNLTHAIYLEKSFRVITIDAFILIMSVMEMYSILRKNYLQTKFWLAVNFFCVLNSGVWLLLFSLFEETIGTSKELMADFGQHIG